MVKKAKEEQEGLTGYDYEERRFQELVSSLNTRESSTLVVATVASSASLVLLGIALTDNKGNGAVLYWAGVFFPVLGLMYREMTIFSADRWDYLELRTLVGHLKRAPYKSRWVRHIRRGFMRLFLMIPTAIWLADFSSPPVVVLSYTIVVPVISIVCSEAIALLVAAALGYFERQYKDVPGQLESSPKTSKV